MPVGRKKEPASGRYFLKNDLPSVSAKGIFYRDESGKSPVRSRRRLRKKMPASPIFSAKRRIGRLVCTRRQKTLFRQVYFPDEMGYTTKKR